MRVTGAEHAHTHRLVAPVRTRRVLGIVAAVSAAVTAAAMVVLGFGTETEPDTGGFLVGTVYEAQVRAAELAPCTGTQASDEIDCRVVTIALRQGPDRGEERTLEFPTGSASSPDLDPGDRIVVSYSEGAEPGFEYQFQDRQRRPVLLWLAAVFAVAVVLLGRLRGLAALAGLAASLLVIGQFVLPNILDGESPVLVSVVGAAAIAYLALFLAHGFTAMTTVALLGTLASLGLTVVLSAVFTNLARFSGFASEDALVLGTLAGTVDVNGLVLGGIVIGALGALDDMTVTQASAVAELREANPSLTRRQLYRSGIRIGRDHVASTVNTLALAYAGASLPLMLLLVLSRQSLGTVANGELVATEIVRTLVGSIGLVASVPITTWLAARVVAQPAAAGPAPAPGESPPGAVAAPPRSRERRRFGRRRPRPRPSPARPREAEPAADPGEVSFWE